MDRGERAQVVEAAEDLFRRVLSEDADELVVEAGAAYGREVANIPLQPIERLRLDLEAEARRVADAAGNAGGVVLEGAVVEDAHEARVEVGAAAGRIDDLACVGAVQPERERVDGEVSAEEVIFDRCGSDGRESARAAVGLGARGDEVDVEAGDSHGGGEEGGVGDYPRLERRRRRSSYERLRTSGTSLVLSRQGFRKLVGQRYRVAFDGDVEVERGPVEEEVAQGTADEVDRQAATIRELDELVEQRASGSGEALA